MSNKTKHIIILVAGTVDPVCLTANNEKRATSYNSSNNYWAENPDFINGLKALCNEYPQLALFDAHGWSGDNTKENREIAGAYLANRLCGSNGQTAYYSGYRTKNVAFHLIGHSHGGNVLNEFTKRAACADEWPEQWKINSVTYLSTPFFKHQHQLDCRQLSSNCRIINVANDFDLTQRVIADFSLYDLVSAYKLVNQNSPGLYQAISEIKKASFMTGINKLISVFSEPSALTLLFNSADYKLSDDDGEVIYRETGVMLDHVVTALTEFKNIIDKLSNALYHPSDQTVDRLTPESTRHFVSAELKEEMDKFADALIHDVSKISHAISQRAEKKDYSITPLLGDIAPELNRIIDFFTIDVEQAKGPFVDIFYALLTNQIENFDNTRTTPVSQLTHELKSQLSDVDVSVKDIYHQGGDLQGFAKFIKQLELAEVDYENTPTQKNLMKICITMLAPQTELKSVKEGLKSGIKMLDGIFGTHEYSLHRFLAKSVTLWGDMTPIRKLAIRLQTLLKSYDHLIEEFNVELLTPVQKTDNPENAAFKGTLAHFSTVSHSVSRETLHPEVIDLLRPQIENNKEIA